jgi:outer membrane protein assembly factor BamA
MYKVGDAVVVQVYNGEDDPINLDMRVNSIEFEIDKNTNDQVMRLNLDNEQDWFNATVKIDDLPEFKVLFA